MRIKDVRNLRAQMVVFHFTLSREGIIKVYCNLNLYKILNQAQKFLQILYVRKTTLNLLKAAYRIEEVSRKLLQRKLSLVYFWDEILRESAVALIWQMHPEQGLSAFSGLHISGHGTHRDLHLQAAQPSSRDSSQQLVPWQIGSGQDGPAIWDKYQKKDATNGCLHTKLPSTKELRRNVSSVV